MAQPISRMLSLQAITFLHPGTGQSTGVVDLPVQREVYTGHPMCASSGLKGSLRDKSEQLWKDNHPDWITTLFGSEAKNEADNLTAGSVSVTDARIMAFPVRSLQQVFVWVTCPIVINRLVRDARLVNLKLNTLTLVQDGPAEGEAWVTEDAVFTEPLVLEEISYSTVSKKDEVLKTAEVIKIITGDAGFDRNRLVMISDDEFSYFVKHATQVSARIKLNDRKTTTGDGGNLWYEETIPPETIFYAFSLCHKPRFGTEEINEAKDVKVMLEKLCADNFIQIGGNETVGQGWCHMNVSGGDSK